MSKEALRNELLQAFDREAGDTKSAPARLAFDRRGLSESEQLRMVMRDPFQRVFWSGFGKALGGASRWLTPEERDAVNVGLVDSRGREIFAKSLTSGSAPGTLWLSEDVAKAVFDICPLYGAYKTLRMIQLAKGRSKFVKVTGLPTAFWMIPNVSQGATIPVDTTLAGASTSQECNTLGINLEISEELLQDEKVDWGTALLEKIARGTAYALDYACFAADGTADIWNGGQTGLFKVGTVPVVHAGAGHTTIYNLTHDDFLLAPAAIRPAGLQHGGRWWVHPSLIPKLLLLKDGNIFLVQTPAQSPSGEWTLCGWPMTLTTWAPNDETAGLPIAAFGWGDAYTIGLRQDTEIMTGAPKWNQALKNIRALTRCRCDMGDATMFAILKLAAT
jgi:HK97 family phage major capsid protein